MVGNVLIDAGILPSDVRPFREQIDIIVLTHCHHDHTAHLKEIAHLCGAKVAIHPADAPGLMDDASSLSLHFGSRAAGVMPDRLIEDGDQVGPLLVLHTPGHTPGSICLFFEAENALISGDTVFSDGCFGRYDFSGGSRVSLEHSLERLAQLPVEGLYPGHGSPVEKNGRRHIAAAVELLKRSHG